MSNEKNVLITGAARRLGSLIAEDLAASGYFVWIHYRSHRNEAAALKTRILSVGGSAECVQADLSSVDEINAMLDFISNSENRGLSALINNASVFTAGTIRSTSAADWDHVMYTNLRSVWYLSTQAAERFQTIENIISIGDASVSFGYSEHAVYGLSKFALKYLTEQMAAAFSPRIRVNLLSPGYVLRGNLEPEAAWEQRVSKTLTNNDGIVASVLNGIRFLLSDSGMTGTEMIIDNGLQLCGKKQNMM